MTRIEAKRPVGIRFFKTRHFTIALKTPRYRRSDKPGSIVIPLPFQHRLTFRWVDPGLENAR